MRPTCRRNGSIAPPRSAKTASHKAATAARSCRASPSNWRNCAAWNWPRWPRPPAPTPVRPCVACLRGMGEKTFTMGTKRPTFFLNTILLHMKTERMHTMRTWRFKPLHAAVMALALAGGAAGVAGWQPGMLLPAASAQAQAQPQPAANPVLVQGLPDFSPLVDRVGPSVVNIRTTEKIRRSGGATGFPGMDEDMLEFFRRCGLPVPNMPRSPGQQMPDEGEGEERPSGVGSGFILSSDGYIMTNAHVIDGASEVIVTLPDQREFKAKVVGADKRTDVAVVKIEAKGLPAVKIGDVSRLRVGEWVMAIGSPFGLESTVTAGIVSAKQRDTGDYLPFIQTDVAINPGNSGGPLINMRGEVVGINSQIYSRSGGFMGISFAIPMDEAIRISDQLRASGKVTRGRIGVQIGPVAKDVAESIGLSKATGALVSAVEADSPAAKAGLQPGDVILQFDGKTIDKVSDRPRLVGGTKPGSTSQVTVFRRGKELRLPITVAEVPDDETRVTKAGSGGSEGNTVVQATSLGLGVS